MNLKRGQVDDARLKNNIIMRLEDMSPDGSLTLLQQDDGDIIVTVKESGEKGFGSSVEFCLSGSRSPKTCEALRLLMGAMREDSGIEDIQAKWIRYRIFSETYRDAVCKCACPGFCNSIDGEGCFEPCPDHEPELYAKWHPEAGNE